MDDLFLKWCQIKIIIKEHNIIKEGLAVQT